jgi:hypothetical protein
MSRNRRQLALDLAPTFMPRLWDFGYPLRARGYRRSRTAALRLWGYAFRVHLAIADMAAR